MVMNNLTITNKTYDRLASSGLEVDDWILDDIGEKAEKFVYVEGNYYVSNFGRVYNTQSNKITVNPLGDDKYYRIRINKKKYRIHKLVAEIFVPNPENKPFVDHIDGDRYNNRADNLEWVTEEENVQRRSIYEMNYNLLTVRDIKDIRRKVSVTQNIDKVREEYQISMPNMKNILENMAP